MAVIEQIKKELNARLELASVYSENSAWSAYKSMLDYVIELEKQQNMSDSYYDNLAKALRELWPAGNKVVTDKRGNAKEYPWRESVTTLSSRLKHLWAVRKLPFVPIETCIGIAQRYLSQFESDTKYMKTLKYFILRQDRLISPDGSFKCINSSQFADMLEGKADEDAIQNEWEQMLNGCSTLEEGMLI